ncbi:MAG: hypothetical protein K0S08_1411 [Gammaproteobacteria bacterium]|nr:hypothetical protein [Gammaproteobacteria bacterium]
MTKRTSDELNSFAQSSSKHYCHSGLFQAPQSPVSQEQDEKKPNLVLSSSQTQSSLDSGLVSDSTISEDDDESLLRKVRPEMRITPDKDPLSMENLYKLYCQAKNTTQESTSNSDEENSEDNRRSVRPEMLITPDKDPLRWDKLLELYGEEQPSSPRP